jgi:threonine dehydratase
VEDRGFAVDSDKLVGLPEVRAAARCVSGAVVRTPLLTSPWTPYLLLKPESLQPTGSFKVRGATHALAQLSEARRAAGVVTHSSGNHGRALAHAARAGGVRCTVVMPQEAPAHKIEAVRALGAEVVLVPAAERAARAHALVAEKGMALVPPYDHPDVIAGQGTIGLEIVEDQPGVEVVLVPVGGGGLASGVAAAVTALRPRAQVIGVEPELAADARESLAAGALRPWPPEQTYRTVADGLRTALSELTLAHLRARLAGIVTVSEQEILDATGRLLHDARLVAEPSGAVATAAYLSHRDELPSGRTVAVVSGGNIDPALLRQLAGAGS